ncbi:thiol reductant ABC exporter subunit CydD [Marinobacterium litorale]|uniref:thiol reductant ABC exporter subunit CydD n=1 Tax=Marinobacterium litorale TaxID=404770 RepID=UPI00041D525A|nr:thiol reductant ABC exporter subunit CydD [Marinobacterium litorale]
MRDLTTGERKARSAWLKQQAAVARRNLSLATAAGVLGALALVAQADQLAQAIAAAVAGATLSQIQPMLVGFLIAVAFRALFSWLKEWFGQRASIRVRRHLRASLLSKLERLGPAYSANARAGGQASLLIEQVEALDGYIARYLPQMVMAVAVPLIILLFVFPRNWAVAAIFLMTAPLVPLFMALVGRRAADANRRNFQALADLSAQFLDVVQGLVTLKLFQRSAEQVRHIEVSSEAFRVRTMEVLRVAFLSSAVLEFFASVSIAVTAVYLGFSFLGELNFGSWEGGVTLEQALFLLLLAPEFYQPLRELGTHYHAKQEAVAAAEPLQDLMAEPEPALQQGVERVGCAEGIAIRFEAVSLTYPGRSQPALSDIRFSIEPGEHVAIIGPSGSGKSSLLSLLQGFYPSSAGQIRVNGTPLEQLDQQFWLDKLAWVSQNTVLFPGTLRDNLLLACPKATDAMLRQACDFAHVSEFLPRLPAGLDTLIDEGNGGLSGGQVQRIALARAYLKNAPVLLLDEPTANLDHDSERWVLEGLEQLAKGKTVLTLTHREAAQAQAGQVYRLERGKLLPVPGETGGER